MSNPSFSNIDLWLFERAEGNLSPEQLAQLELFLLQHPELDVDSDVWQMAKVDKKNYVYPDMASLERKRRPVVAYGFIAFFLLFAGTTSYLFWNGTSDSEADLHLMAAQNSKLKQELLKQIDAIQSESSDSKMIQHQQGYEGVNAVSSQNAFMLRMNDDYANTRRNNQTSVNVPIPFNSTTVASLGFNEDTEFESTEISTSEVGQSALSSVQAGNTALIENVEGTQIAESTNSTYSAPILPEENISQVLDLFEVTEFNEKAETDPFGGRKWNPNRTQPNSIASNRSNYEKPSFKDRLSTFGRNLDRMMSAPIALKNSREPHYHVPGLTPSDISFSTAGTVVATRVQTNSRIQWLGSENEQFSNQVSVDGYSQQMRGGWGLQLNHQWYKDGGIQVGQAAVTYSPKISVSRWISVEPSIRLKMGNKRLDADLLEGVSMVEMDRGNEHDFYPNGAAPIGKNLWYKDLGLGMLVNTKWFFAGVQLDNLFRHKDNVYDNDWIDPRRAHNYFTATFGTDWMSRNEKLKFSPYVVYQNNERLSEAWAGANFSWHWLTIGAATSTNLEPAASLGIRFDHFSLIYNADYTHSRMLNEKALSHQVTLRFVGMRNKFGKQMFN